MNERRKKSKEGGKNHLFFSLHLRNANIMAIIIKGKYFGADKRECEESERKVSQN